MTVDVLCQTSDGSVVAVEVQKKREDDPPRRARFERSCADTWITRKGTEFAEIPRVAAVYISRSDPFGDGLPLYHADKVVRETGRRVDDGTLDVYANAASASGDSDVERLLRYLVCSEGDLAGFPALSARVQYFKQTEEGRSKMSELVEEYARGMAQEAAEAARAEGLAEGKAEGELSGLTKGVLLSLGNLMSNLGWSAGATMDALGVPESERAGYLAKLL